MKNHVKVGLRDKLGHVTIETTVLYTNLSQDEQRKILKKIDKEPEKRNESEDYSRESLLAQ